MDIVKRLRSTELWTCQDGIPVEDAYGETNLGKEAADEIARLDEELKQGDRNLVEAIEQRDRALAEIARLQSINLVQSVDIQRLRARINCVVETFEKDEAQGYRSKDRQFAISVLRGGHEQSTSTDAKAP